MNNLKLSNLGHTWLLDFDGTIVIHNGYKNGGDELLPGVREFFSTIPKGDMIIFVTSRLESERTNIERFLQKNGIQYSHIICGAPFGERILINDSKPSGLVTSIAVSKVRDAPFEVNCIIDPNL